MSYFDSMILASNIQIDGGEDAKICCFTLHAVDGDMKKLQYSTFLVALDSHAVVFGAPKKDP